MGRAGLNAFLWSMALTGDCTWLFLKHISLLFDNAHATQPNAHIVLLNSGPALGFDTYLCLSLLFLSLGVSSGWCICFSTNFPLCVRFTNPSVTFQMLLTLAHVGVSLFSKTAEVVHGFLLHIAFVSG